MPFHILAPEADRKDLLRFIVFELDMQTVFDPDFHLDGHIRIWWHSEAVYPDILLLDHVA